MVRFLAYGSTENKWQNQRMRIFILGNQCFFNCRTLLCSWPPPSPHKFCSTPSLLPLSWAVPLLPATNLPHRSCSRWQNLSSRVDSANTSALWLSVASAVPQGQRPYTSFLRTLLTITGQCRTLPINLFTLRCGWLLRELAVSFYQREIALNEDYFKKMFSQMNDSVTIEWKLTGAI